MLLAIMRKTAMLLLAVIGFTAFAKAQTVTGTVTDSKGDPISGISVTVKGSTKGTSTNALGVYTLTGVANGATLLFSGTGFTAQEIKANSGIVNATMAANISNLNEVVVIGYGTARRKDVTGAVASVQAKDFNQGVIAAPDQLLQNKVAGLEVTSNGGQPGSAATVKIRGNNSIRAGGNPLYVIDGVPLDGRSARPNFGTGVFGSTPDANPLIFVNPNDIQDITVLKDAASAAIYGSRGANGVIVITTKTGSSGASKIEFGSSWSVNAGLMKKYEILDAGEFRSALSKYAITGQDKGASVDPFKELMNKKLSQSYNMALSGGNENGKFRASFLASSSNGAFKNSQLDKYVGNFTGQYKFLDKKLTLGFNLTAGHTTEDIIAVSNTAGSQGNIISSALQWNPTTAFKDASGIYVYPTNGSGNPLALLDGYNDIAKINSVLGNVTAGYKIMDNLEYKFLFALNNSIGERYTNIYGFLQGYAGLSGQGFGAISNQKLNSQTTTHTLSYKTELTKNISFDAVAGFEYWKTNFQNSSFSASGFNTNLSQATKIDIPYTAMLQNGIAQNAPSIYIDPKTELQSYFGRVGFNYSDKYYLSASVRADGSSKFGANNKYGYFPAVGAKWAISNEAFMKGNSYLSNLALRASWGITGNQEFPAGAAQEQFLFTQNNTVSQINVANPDLQWEQTNSFNIGLDFNSKNGKIYGSIDYYNKNTTKILYQSTAIQPAPASVYFINLPANLINNGIEISLGASVIEKADLSWDVRFNYAHNKNLLKNFTQNGQDIKIQTGQINGQGVSGTLGQIITNNQPVNAYYLKAFGGFDASGNQIIGTNPAIAGDPNPKDNYGISSTLRYKKLNLVINCGGAAGFLIYNNTATSVTNISGISNGRNIDKNAYNSAEKTSSPVGASTRFLEKGNFFKLRNVSLSYNIGNAGKYVKNLNAFVNATNLFVITKFSGFDPEVNVDKSNNNYPSRSIEYIPYPTARAISFGFKFSL
ncbi:SusC/RagA family TonB-linked outer membrane protein [Ferruginibacter profundus]